MLIELFDFVAVRGLEIQTRVVNSWTFSKTALNCPDDEKN